MEYLISKGYKTVGEQDNTPCIIQLIMSSITENRKVRGLML